MKKNRLLFGILCLALLFSLLPWPASATLGGISDPVTEPDGSVIAGSHSIDAQVPLWGSNKMLETSAAAILYETNTDTLVYAWNPDTPRYPGALVKMMTGFLAAELGNMDAVITVTEEALSALPLYTSTLKLRAGEIVTLKQLMYALFVGGANDAAVVISHHIGGSEEQFVQMMNDRAKEMGCTSTTFTNSTGIHNNNQMTTARDVAKFLEIASENEVFMDFFSSTFYTFPETNLSPARESMLTTNYLMTPGMEFYYDERVTGGRTGTTSDNKRCLAITADNGNLSYIVIILEAIPIIAEDGYTAKRFGNLEEAATLLDLGYRNYDIFLVLMDTDITNQYTVTNGANAVAVGPATEIRALLPKTATRYDLEMRYLLNESSIVAPIEIGQPLATMQVWYENVCVAQGPVVARNAVKEYVPQQDRTGGTDTDDLIMILTVIGVILGVILCVLGVMFVIQLARRAGARAQHRRRRQSRRRSR